MILVIDNYDSFTFNLVQYLGELGEIAEVYRNDAITVDRIRELRPERIVISPGPGRPEEAGIIVDAIRTLGPAFPILGVCLGHQAIGAAFGGNVVRSPQLMHGKTSLIRHDGKSIFQGLPDPFRATRYHSLVIDPGSLPACLEVSARTDAGIIMGVRHREFPIEGVQFHPESILTEGGKQLLANFVARGRA
jgi:anthranilate synthase/aminodeoxychorismate synthase-like glutamine amidotransferase